MVDDVRFDVFVRSGSGTVTLLRGATLKQAAARAQVEARSGRSAFVLNQATRETKEFKPTTAST